MCYEFTSLLWYTQAFVHSICICCSCAKGCKTLNAHSESFATGHITTWHISDTLTAFYLLSKPMLLLFGTISRESELKIRLLSSRMLRDIQVNNVLHLQVHGFDEGTVTSVCGTQLPAPSQQVEQCLMWFNSENKAAFEQNNSQIHPKSPCTPSLFLEKLVIVIFMKRCLIEGDNVGGVAGFLHNPSVEIVG